jgi:hypothetical protein
MYIVTINNDNGLSPTAPTPRPLPIPMPSLDEPLDMSLKSRKRAASGGSSLTSNSNSNKSDTDSGIKKSRPSVISYGKSLAGRRGLELNNFHLKSLPPAPPGPHFLPIYNIPSYRPRPMIQPRLVITKDYSQDGIDEHFRKSLSSYMKKDNGKPAQERPGQEKENDTNTTNTVSST